LTNPELMQVRVRPAHYELNNPVQLGKPDIAWDLYPPPDERANISQANLELMNFCYFGFSLDAVNVGVIHLSCKILKQTWRFSFLSARKRSNPIANLLFEGIGTCWSPLRSAAAEMRSASMPKTSKLFHDRRRRYENQVSGFGQAQQAMRNAHP
jgi:hypothetical protein